jgi:hypothetical protein
MKKKRCKKWSWWVHLVRIKTTEGAGEILSKEISANGFLFTIPAPFVVKLSAQAAFFCF